MNLIEQTLGGAVLLVALLGGTYSWLLILEAVVN
jgi:hypothetical protein